MKLDARKIGNNMKNMMGNVGIKSTDLGAVSTISKYHSGHSLVPLYKLVELLNLLRETEQYKDITLDDIITKSFESNKIVPKISEEDILEEIRNKEALSDREYDLVVRTKHDKETQAYIDADHSSVSFAYEANDGTDDYDDLTIKDMQKIDKACMNYLEKQVSKDKFNPSDIGSKSFESIDARKAKRLVITNNNV